MVDKVLVYDPKKKKIVLAGYYDDNKQIFIKICLSKHFMVKESGYGISEEVIERLKFLSCKRIVIYTKTMQLISKFDSWVEVKPRNYGHGLQRFLKTEQMRKLK